MQTLLKGIGSIRHAAELASSLSMKRPLLVGGRTLTERLLGSSGLKPAAVFSAYQPNPEFGEAAAGAALYRSEHCDGIISIGGGSAMDTAKAVKSMLLAQSDEAALRSELDGTVSVPHLAIPGTAGTGSEATCIGVVYTAGKKVSLDHPVLLPEAVILDPQLLSSLPDRHRRACALDAFCQGIESWWSRRATPESRTHATAAFMGILRWVTPYLAGDPEAAAYVQEAAYESGRAISMTRTTAAHAMSYGLTKKLGYPHGQACALTLPHLWRRLCEAPETREMMLRLAQTIGLSSAENGWQLACGLLTDLGMQAGPAPDAELLAELTAAVNAQRLQNHPETLTPEQIRGVYVSAFRPLNENDREACLAVWRAL